jgi:IS30 family transposase
MYLINITTLGPGVTEYNLTDLAQNEDYYYNVTICDKANHCNTTETRLITLFNGLEGAPECQDGEDNDGDGRIDYPNDPEMRITFESIYYHIYMHLDSAKREALIERLRQSRRARGNANRGKNRRPTITDRVMIDERPEGANSRQEAGHWEGDLVLGKNRESAIGTIVERKTRHLIIVPLKKRDATSVRIAFEKEFRKIPLKMRKSMTYDNGSEMAQHKLLSKNTKMKIYFAHPYSPWERPTNENFNGLIRDYFPKGTDFNTISPKELKYVQNELNERPRKVLNMNTPKAVFQSLISTPL